ncbi:MULTISPECIES: AraC family transcriptional regulator [Olivibacter]|jgi:AraC-like DNA-binding protein/mannose-6-phosphate isomerase-like protein (cupin superfamily)|uniref:AraC family transcriptional regulator n=2 Tax=Olivibacter TaxID=376469 RepID=A0ABV6HLR8_9SPHI|nr:MULTISPECIES: AraC family transcriptional regulator [Olivibacter]MCL4638091.1 AraC family transcriptional regulator [Olivibacter sp. UJ_SKK_5.1]MDM8175883.1 AraC family transcriptional regulator [Olivibacter sp. 47]MDX3914491.1 AraC family transcriptional regulator [Pseudosphingobacterium sp.]QEL02609.1 AraC family transcriptional regulator [Olivibacter sp. LS-1]
MIRKKEGFEGEKAIIIPPKVVNQYRDTFLTREFYITDIGFYPKAKYHYRNRPEGTNEHILIHCVEGRGSATIDGFDLPIEANHFLIIPTGTQHLYRADPAYPWTIYWLHFGGKQADLIVAHLFEKMLSQKNKIMRSEPHLALFSKIYNTLQQGYSKENMEFIALTMPFYLSAFLLNDRFNYHPDEQAEDIVDRTIRFLKTSIHKTLSLKEIADQAHLSVSHFSNLFHKKTGYSPIEYFNHLKIQHACQLLQFSDRRIFEIALAIGIEDPYYFSRLFSTQMGISPKQYRKQWTLSKS